MPEIRARLADGTTLVFADGTPDNVVDRIVQQHVQTAKLKEIQAAKYPSAQEQTPDTRSAGQVAIDQAMNVGKGALGLIPGMIKTGGNALIGAGKMAAGQYREGANQVSDAAADVITGAAAPFKAAAVVGRGLNAATNDNANPPSRQEWEESAQTGGAMAAGAGMEAALKIGTPERLQTLANKARDYRTDNPILDTLSNADVTKPFGAIRGAVQAAKSTGAAVAAPVLEKLARIRAGTPEPASLNFPEQNVAPELAGTLESPDAAARLVNASRQAAGPIPSYDPAAPTGTPSLPTMAERTAEQTRVDRVRELRGIQQRQWGEEIDNTPLMDTSESPTPWSNQPLPENTGIKLEGGGKAAMEPQPYTPQGATLQNYNAPTFGTDQPAVNVPRPEAAPVPQEPAPVMTPPDQRTSMNYDPYAQTGTPVAQDAGAGPLEQGRYQIDQASQQQVAAPQFEHPIEQLTPDEQGILSGIFREGKGAAASVKNMNLAIRNAPYLLQAIPELQGTPPGAVFDGKLFNGFQTIGHALKAMEESIPDTKPVQTGEAVAALTALESEAVNTMQNDAARAIGKVKAKFENKPVMPWKDFIEAKRAFDDEVGVDSSTGSKIYQVFKDMSNKVSPELGEINQKYYTARLAIDLAKMHTYKGLRLAEVATKAKGLRK